MEAIVSSTEKLIDLLEPMANKHETIDYMYWVTVSRDDCKIDDENMTEHGSLEDYCEECIGDAVEKKHREWASERNILMGQIYEAKQKGFYTYFGYSNGKSRKYVYRKVRVNNNQIKGMERKLKKNFRIGTKFSKDGMLLCMYETNGFRSCECCGKMFDTTLLLDSQELEHWESMEYKDFKELDERQAYELKMIMQEGGCETHKLNDRVNKLAEKILNIITA